MRKGYRSNTLLPPRSYEALGKAGQRDRVNRSRPWQTPGDVSKIHTLREKAYTNK